MSKTKHNPPFPLKHKKFDWDKFWEEVPNLAAELKEIKDREGRKHCRCCPAHPEYEEMNHEAYE